VIRAFGCEVDLHPDWKKANVDIALTMLFDGKPITFIRKKDVYKIVKDNKVQVFTSMTTGLAPEFAKIFNFKLQLTKKHNSEPALATPSFMFHPFYIDQDDGWNDIFSSIIKLDYFKSWMKPMIEFHAGMKSNEYYEFLSEKEQIKVLAEEKSKKVTLLAEMLKRQNDKKFNVGVTFSLDEFKADIEKILKRLDSLKGKQDVFKEKLVEKNSKLLMVREQQSIAKAALSETGQDYSELLNQEGMVICPCCEAEYENDFETRLQVAVDQSELVKLADQLKAEEGILVSEVSLLKQESDHLQSEYNELRILLDTKHKQILINDVLKAKGLEEVIKDLEEDFKTVSAEVAKYHNKMDELDSDMKLHLDKDKKKSINDFFVSLYNDHLATLDVTAKGSAYIKSITDKVKESGSDLPRAILAYFFAFIATRRKFNNLTEFPVVIDSPNQNAQDYINL
jgi:hypothetical protein